MKTIYKLILALLAILAAAKMFAGGGVSKEGAKKQSVQDLARQAALDKDAERSGLALAFLSVKSEPLTDVEIAKINSMYDYICKHELYRSKQLLPGGHLDGAVLFNHPAIIEALGKTKTKNGNLIITTENLKNALTTLTTLESKRKKIDRTACWNAVIAIMEKEGIIKKETAKITPSISKAVPTLPTPIAQLIAEYAL